MTTTIHVPITMSADQLVEKLESLKPAARTADKVSAAMRRQDERAALEEWRKGLRAELRLSYAEARKTKRRYRSWPREVAASTNWVEKIDAAIKAVQRSGKNTLTASRDNAYHAIYNLLLEGEDNFGIKEA